MGFLKDAFEDLSSKWSSGWKIIQDQAQSIGATIGEAWKSMFDPENSTARNIDWSTPGSKEENEWAQSILPGIKMPESSNASASFDFSDIRSSMSDVFSTARDGVLQISSELIHKEAVPSKSYNKISNIKDMFSKVTADNDKSSAEARAQMVNESLDFSTSENSKDTGLEF